MAKAMHESSMRGHKSFAKRMSDNVAVSLVIYTLMLIFVVTPSVETTGMSIFPYFLLVLLVGGIIPFFRRYEKRWAMLDESELSENSLRTRFNMDRAILWVVAIGVPFLLAVICRAVTAAL
jgi:hypothetical protein